MDSNRSGSVNTRIFRPVARLLFRWAARWPQFYKEFFDPFIGLAAAAAVTTKLKVGTGVCLVPEHNPINLAKMVSCLDRVANGRFLFGIGA
jgi:alkanesulfonate monooxygenase SsuD/methylene tetrahydromethanopterin reductase-like flavin-dependent oxidoreductase (luciferase family)